MMADFELPETMTLRPSRRPVIGNAEFRSAMAGMGSTVCVVAGKRGDEIAGRTVTAVLSLSATPPSVLVSIDIMSRLADIIAKTQSFSLSMLATEHEAVANAFAGKVEAADRFQVGDWISWPSGQPLLNGAVTAFECDVIGAIETGTHVLFAGAIVEAETATDKVPLIWQRHGYHGLV